MDGFFLVGKWSVNFMLFDLVLKFFYMNGMLLKEKYESEKKGLLKIALDK